VSKGIHMPLAKLRIWQPFLLKMTSPRCQHYLFRRRVLDEPVATAVVLSAGEDKLMKADEMRAIAAGSAE
jgi:hypothetical protein